MVELFLAHTQQEDMDNILKIINIGGAVWKSLTSSPNVAEVENFVKAFFCPYIRW
jgi:hypothetical protein